MRIQYGAPFIFLILSISAITVLGQAEGENLTLQDINNQQFNPQFSGGDIMLTSATIIGFGGFGGILATRFRANKVKTQVICTMIIYGAIMIKMMLHLYVIQSLFSYDLSLPAYQNIILVTSILIGVIIVCFGIISLIQQRYDKSVDKMDHNTDDVIRDITQTVKKTAV